MAKPVPYRVYTPADPREELKRRIEDAPLEHAEAVLSGYRLLERAHESGLLELLRGALAAEDTIISNLVEMAARPEMMNAARNLLILGKLVGSIDPATLEKALSEETEHKKAPPSLLSLAGRMNTGDARRGLRVALGLLSTLGAASRKGK